MNKINDGVVFDIIKGIVKGVAIGIINNAQSIVNAGAKIAEIITEDTPKNKGKK